MEGKMNKEEVYEFIGRLAVLLYSQAIRISLRSLMAILQDQGVKYNSPRGMGAGVAAAYRMWVRRGDEVFPPAIALTFLDQGGEPAWKKYQHEDEEPFEPSPGVAHKEPHA
jgi:hypothetical protein